MAFWLFRFFGEKHADRLDSSVRHARELWNQGRHAEARAACERNLMADSRHAETLRLVAEMSHSNGQIHEAIAAYDRLLEAHPDAAAFYKRANLQKDSGRSAEALRDYDRAIALEPSLSAAHCNRGVVLERLGDLETALASFDTAIELDPRDSISHYNRGGVLRTQGRLPDALASYDQAVALNPGYADALCNRGSVLMELRRWQDAQLSFDAAIIAAPGFAPAFFNRGALHQRRGRRNEALSDYDRAIALNPGYDEPVSARGMLMAAIGRHEEAILLFDKAIALNPQLASAHVGKGDSLVQMKLFESAIVSYDRALSVEPDRKYVAGMRLHCQMHICQWGEFDDELSGILSGIRAGRPVMTPFPFTALIDSGSLQRMAAELYAREEHPSDDSMGDIRSTGDGRIRVGYFSPDFREHPVAYLTAELMEVHDREKFEIIAFAFGPESNDPWTSRLRKAFDRFIDVRAMSDADVASLARQLKLDIAIDLSGYTAYNRMGIFSFRAAPAQIGYIGYLGTTGAPYMDYIIADPVLIPDALQDNYTEKVVCLPSYQANDSQRRVSDRVFTKQELGLRGEDFVYCCFNAAYKIVPSVFGAWMRILRQVANSSLFLYVNDEVTKRNLRAEAQKAGVDPFRLVFGGHIPREDYLARYRAFDLFLDTQPYNAGTTASDALWVGLPVLTCLGESFAGRMAASLLTTLNLPELIAPDLASYERRAIELARQPQLMSDIRAKLAAQRSVSPLFNARRFAATLEAAFQEISDRARRGAPADHIYIK